jgi:glycolate oxidase FAD binding subunit
MSAPAALTLEQGMSHLGSVVGEENVRLRREANQTIVAAPGDAPQIAEVLRFANANALTVMPSGGRTKLGWGNAVFPDIELSLIRLNALREHAWQDMTCTVQAGCAWAAMQDQLRRHGQMVALDPLWPERATVGGIVACNDSGALRLQYGGLRDLIIGMTVVLADGTLAKSGGKVVKNVAGYDIHKLMTGSFGTLGVITEVNFRLHPAEEHARTWTARLPDGEPVTALAEPLRGLMDSQLVPSGVQIRIGKGEGAFDVRVAGLPECLDEYRNRIESIFGRLALEDGGENAWDARQALFDRKDALILKVSLLPTEICALCEDLREWGGGAEIIVVAQAIGLMAVAINAVPETASALLDRLRARVEPSGGSAVVLHAPDPLQGRIEVWGSDRGTLPLMREIKRRFDPHRILNPGRFVGNL